MMQIQEFSVVLVLFTAFFALFSLGFVIGKAFCKKFPHFSYKIGPTVLKTPKTTKKEETC